jgi:hypothetical protein
MLKECRRVITMGANRHERKLVRIKYERRDYLQIFSHTEHHVAWHEPFADGV